MTMNKIIEMQDLVSLVYHIFYKSTIGGGGIWTLDVSVRNTKRYQLSYKALGNGLVYHIYMLKLLYLTILDIRNVLFQKENCVIT